MQERNGGAGVYSSDERRRYLLEDLNWRRDIIPEIMDGHNIADYVDPEIEAKLEALDRDEDERMATFEASVRVVPPSVLQLIRLCWPALVIAVQLSAAAALFCTCPVAHPHEMHLQELAQHCQSSTATALLRPCGSST